MCTPLVAVDYNYDMYDVLTTRYTFACPARGKTSVRLSAFREVDRLSGAAHPAVFRVRLACGCGEDHVGLVAHDDLDWAPLGLDDGATFLNLMTAARASTRRTSTRAGCCSNSGSFPLRLVRRAGHHRRARAIRQREGLPLARLARHPRRAPHRAPLHQAVLPWGSDMAPRS